MKENHPWMKDLAEFVMAEFGDGSSDSIEPEDDLMRQGLLDSFAVLRLVEFMEREFDVEIPDSDITVKNFRNLRSIANLLERRSSSV